MNNSQNKIVDCILTKGVEFFEAERNVLRAFHGESILKFEELPQFAYDTIKRLMNDTSATMEEMHAFAYDRWRILDGVPDIDEQGNASDPEFVPGYSKTYSSDGITISEAQMRVLQLIQLDNKLIAEKLYVSPYTVARHCQDMFNTTGIQNRTQLGIWATQKGII